MLIASPGIKSFPEQIVNRGKRGGAPASPQRQGDLPGDGAIPQQNAQVDSFDTHDSRVRRLRNGVGIALAKGQAVT